MGINFYMVEKTEVVKFNLYTTGNLSQTDCSVIAFGKLTTCLRTGHPESDCNKRGR